MTLKGSCHPNPCGWLDSSSGSPLALESSSLRGFVDEQQAPIVPFSCVPYPSPPRPWACPLPAFPGQSKCGVGNHNICCPGDSCQGTGLRWACGTLAQRERPAYIPTSASTTLRTEQDHSPTNREKLRPNEAGAALGLPDPEQKPRPLLRLLAFPPLGKQDLAVRP